MHNAGLIIHCKGICMHHWETLGLIKYFDFMWKDFAWKDNIFLYLPGVAMWVSRRWYREFICHLICCCCCCCWIGIIIYLCWWNGIHPNYVTWVFPILTVFTQASQMNCEHYQISIVLISYHSETLIFRTILPILDLL